MKKTLALVCFITVFAVCFAACGSSSGDPSATTFELKSDGTIVHTIVAENTYGYDEDEMKSFFVSEIAAYNEGFDEDRVTLDEFRIKSGDTVFAQITYASCADYAAFNDVTCYDGTLVGAVKSGYSFEREMTAVSGNTIVGFTLPAEYPSLNVLILQEGMDVIVPGIVTAYSSLVTNADGYVTIAYSPDENVPEYFRTINSNTEYIVYTSLS